MIPESNVILYRLFDRLKDFFNRSLAKKVFLVEIGSSRIRSDWCDISEFDTVVFDGNVYDYMNSFTWYGKNTVIVRRGLRIPLNFFDYDKIFKDFEKDKHSQLAFYSKTAHAKMNNGNMEAFIRANKHADIILYAVVASCACGLLILVSLFDYIHLPWVVDMRENFVVLVNQTRMIYP